MKKGHPSKDQDFFAVNLEQAVMEANQAISQANNRVVKIKNQRRKKEEIERRLLNLEARKEEINKTFITEPNERLVKVGEELKNKHFDEIQNKLKILNKEKASFLDLIHLKKGIKSWSSVHADANDLIQNTTKRS